MTAAGNPDVAAAMMALAGGHGRLLWHKSKPWASASFAGSRDELGLEFMGVAAVDAGSAMLLQLRDAEFALPGRCVADVELRWNTRLYRPQERIVAVIELLIVED